MCKHSFIGNVGSIQLGLNHFVFVYLWELLCIEEEWDMLLPLDATKFHLFLELVNIANARREVKLSPCIVLIKGCKPPVPLFLGGFSFLEIANDRELKRRIKSFFHVHKREREHFIHVERKCVHVCECGVCAHEQLSWNVSA